MGQEKSLYRPTTLTSRQREKIFDKTAHKIIKNYFDPGYNGTNWPVRAAEERSRIVAIAEPEAFEIAMHDLVRSLRTSHTGFFHRSVQRVPARLAIGASFRRVETPSGAGWVVQDVHEGGRLIPLVFDRLMC
ncbi:MAG: hypothetical protein JO091_10440 [Acidobacteriaceae bacterium]|nr:hypothetical protein [Acidobacteriaceae bacterium]